MKNKRNKKNKNIFIVLLTTAVIAVAAVVIIQIFTPGIAWLFTKPGVVCDGELPGVTNENQITEIPKGEIKFLINKNVIFQNKSSRGNFMFENPEVCEYSIKFYIYKQIGEGEKEKLLYASPLLSPGQYLTEDKLSKKLGKGKYNCTYIAKAYKNGALQGDTDGTLTITVKS